MSLINDALKQARKAPPRNTPSSLPPLAPVAEESSPILGWLLPAVVIILIVAAIFFIGWAVAHHSVHSFVAQTPADTNTQVLTLPVVSAAPAPTPEPEAPPDLPKLQAIFYSPKTPEAIIDGHNVKPGDKFGQYKVKTISKYTVTLIGPDKKEIQLGMGN